MGLATSQVRLLTLTSRKADVELQMQLDSKRKTMLTRKSTELSKLYYAKLQNSTIQYSTTNGYQDVNYNYLMANSDSAFFDQVATGSGSAYAKKASDNMILTDMYGKVVLDADLMDIYIKATNTLKGTGTTEDKTLEAISQLLNNKNQSSTISSSIYAGFQAMYKDVTGGVDGPKRQALEYLLENGYNQAGTVYYNNGEYYNQAGTTDTNYKVTNTMANGSFYQVLNSSDKSAHIGGNYDYQMYWKGASNSFISDLSSTYVKELVNIMKYYGSIFSAAFNNGVSGTFNHTSNIATGTYANTANNLYTTASKTETLQAGLKSGVFQLVNVDSAATGHYSKGQNLDYFVTQNLVSEQTDQSAKEEITAWYNSEKADLDEKESYWDTEITQLSTELNTITTEIDSVKSLRDNAIQSVFKWGSA